MKTHLSKSFLVVISVFIKGPVFILHLHASNYLDNQVQKHQNYKNTRNPSLSASGMNITYRGCSLDSGSLTADTELARMSHCGYFVLEEE
jgi:hypothetical protein